MARFKRQNLLTYDPRFYAYADMSRQLEDPRAEYRKLRNAAMNRIRKLEKAGYGDTETVRRAREVFSDLPRNLTQDQAAQALPDAARFLTSARGTVGGMREIERKTARTFRDRGFDFVNEKNIREFTEFLDEVGSQKLSDMFYEAVSNAPREGGQAQKKVKVSELKEAFSAWRKRN